MALFRYLRPNSRSRWLELRYMMVGRPWGQVWGCWVDSSFLTSAHISSEERTFPSPDGSVARYGIGQTLLPLLEPASFRH